MSKFPLNSLKISRINPINNKPLKTQTKVGEVLISKIKKDF